jgi:hypothetical protein
MDQQRITPPPPPASAPPQVVYAPVRPGATSRRWPLIIAAVAALAFGACVIVPCLLLGGIAALGATLPTATVKTANSGTGGSSGGTDNWQVTATGVESAKTLTYGSYGASKTATGQWLVVSVSLANRGKENFGVNEWDFELRDSAGVVYKPTTDIISYSYPESKGRAPMPLSQVPPGTTAETMVIFDVNPSATGLYLVFKQGSNPRINLGR